MIGSREQDNNQHYGAKLGYVFLSKSQKRVAGQNWTNASKSGTVSCVESNCLNDCGFVMMASLSFLVHWQLCVG